MMTPDDLRPMERWTSIVLRAGIWASTVTMTAGLLWSFVDPQASDFPESGRLWQEVLSTGWSGKLLTSAGILMLMFTPFLRVLTMLFGFAGQRDWRFALVSFIVFVLLLGEVLYAFSS